MRPEGIILAAGFSSRAGTFKMALPFHGKPMIQHAIEGMLTVCREVIVVGGFKIERIRELTAGNPQVRVVLNTNYEKGMFSSVQEGVGNLTGGDFFIMPGDYPHIHPDVYAELLNALADTAGKDIFIPVFNGRKGHPVLFRRHLNESLLNEPMDSNLKKYIDGIGFQGVDVSHDGILKDIDTMDDYRAVLTRPDS